MIFVLFVKQTNNNWLLFSVSKFFLFLEERGQYWIGVLFGSQIGGGTLPRQPSSIYAGETVSLEGHVPTPTPVLAFVVSWSDPWEQSHVSLTHNAVPLSASLAHILHDRWRPIQPDQYFHSIFDKHAFGPPHHRILSVYLPPPRLGPFPLPSWFRVSCHSIVSLLMLLHCLLKATCQVVSQLLVICSGMWITNTRFVWWPCGVSVAGPDSYLISLQSPEHVFAHRNRVRFLGFGLWFGFAWMFVVSTCYRSTQTREGTMPSCRVIFLADHSSVFPRFKADLACAISFANIGSLRLAVELASFYFLG